MPAIEAAHLNPCTMPCCPFTPSSPALLSHAHPCGSWQCSLLALLRRPRHPPAWWKPSSSRDPPSISLLGESCRGERLCPQSCDSSSSPSCPGHASCFFSPCPGANHQHLPLGQLLPPQPHRPPFYVSSPSHRFCPRAFAPSAPSA